MDELIYIGDAIKAEQLDNGGVKLGGYLVRFGDASQPDLTGDYFTSATDFGQAEKSVTWFNHRLPVRLKKHNVQVSYTEPLPEATLKGDDVGVFAEVIIMARNDYEKTIAELGMSGKLAWSSGTASHLVDRKNISQGVYEITRWPLGLDASLTPTPAEYRQTNQVLPMKAASDPTAAVDAKAAGEVDDFITVRRILHGMTLAHPKAVSQLVEQMAKGDDPKAKAGPLNLQFLMAYRSRRHAALEKVALAPERYVAVREAYLAWRASQPVADAALGRALEARRQHLEAADLGPAEPLDTLLEL